MSVPMKPRPASTLALLRDTADGMEVLMLQRTHQAVFMPGHYVFPGGAVDRNDNDPQFAPVTAGYDNDRANRLLGIDEGGTGYLLAALRECFEEAGVLLARDDQGRLLSGHHPALAHREVVATGELGMQSLCRQYALRLALDEVAYLDHWVTPPGPPRRFDTRFFVAAAPPDQVPHHDGQETIDTIWIAPPRALEDARAASREFAEPTLAVLEQLAAFETVAQVLHGAEAKQPRAVGQHN